MDQTLLTDKDFSSDFKIIVPFEKKKLSYLLFGYVGQIYFNITPFFISHHHTSDFERLLSNQNFIVINI